MSQKGLLKYAAVKKPEKRANVDADSDEDDQDYSKFGSKNNKKAEKDRRLRELEELKKLGKDMIDDDGGAIRLPNRVSKGFSVDPRTGTAKESN